MTLIYLHGLDSSPTATKAILTSDCAKTHGITTLCPNLNHPPQQVMDMLISLVSDHNNAVLIGSSLGGYFATLVSDRTGTPAILLNPSIRPDISFRRFLKEQFNTQPLADDCVIYTTQGGWQITYKQLAWFDAHRLMVKHPNKLGVFLQLGDELLDAVATQAFFEHHGVAVLAQEGGDHRISDYEQYVERIVAWAKQLGC